ncbi:MAG: hypothetical protein ACRD20_13285, partial [Terriglobales bacterium]
RWVILRDFTPEEPALSEVEGIWRAPCQLLMRLPIRCTPDASQAQHDAFMSGRQFKLTHYRRPPVLSLLLSRTMYI